MAGIPLPDLGFSLVRSSCRAALSAAVAAMVAIPLVAAPAQARGPDGIADVAEKVINAVVNISTSQSVDNRNSAAPPSLPPGSPFEEFFDEFFKNRRGGQQGDNNQNRPNTPRRVNSLGSGFIIDPSGIIVTNNHVVGRAEKIVVSLTNGHQYPAKLIGQDPLTDVAVIKVTTNEPLAAVTWGDSRRIEVGDWILAAGNPFGLGGSVTAGIVSAEGRDLGSGPFDNFLQLDAPINPGNSGGPVFNMDGQVIGVSSVIVSPTGASVGIGFAIPSETVSQVVSQLLSGGGIQRGWLGVSLEDHDDGVLIASIDRTGPAARAGVHPGDAVVAINGLVISTSRGMIRAVAAATPGDNARLTVRRQGQTIELPVVVGRRPGTQEE
jgi:serine protease Do